MSAYVISDTSVINADRYESYRAAIGVAVERNGGRYLVRGGEVAILEGIWNPDRLVIIEFPSVNEAQHFFESTEFQQARELRQNAAMVNMILVDGVAPD
jgi:uncharacterized protein (DUF1330 family)